MFKKEGKKFRIKKRKVLKGWKNFKKRKENFKKKERYFF